MLLTVLYQQSEHGGKCMDQPVSTVANGSQKLPGARLAMFGVLLDLAAAIGLTLLRLHLASAGQRHAEGLLPSIALGVLVAVPGVLGVLGIRLRRPVLLGAAAIVCVPLIILSVAALPIVLPATCFAIACHQAWPSVPLPQNRVLYAIVGCIALQVAAVVVWLSGWGQYTYRYVNGGESGSYVRPLHAILAVVLGVAACVVASVLTAERPPARMPEISSPDTE